MQASDFKVGMKVMINKGYPPKDGRGKVGIVTGHDAYFVTVKVAGETSVWLMRPYELDVVTPPSVAADLKLTPQAKSVLQHLRRRGDISPLEALSTYAISRLASCIHEIRRVGYEVKTEIRRDDAGHKYANYQLATIH